MQPKEPLPSRLRKATAAWLRSNKRPGPRGEEQLQIPFERLALRLHRERVCVHPRTSTGVYNACIGGGSQNRSGHQGGAESGVVRRGGVPVTAGEVLGGERERKVVS